MPTRTPIWTTRRIRSVLAIACVMPLSGCLFSALLESGIRSYDRDCKELRADDAQLVGHYLGEREVAGTRWFQFAVPGLLRERAAAGFVEFWVPVTDRRNPRAMERAGEPPQDRPKIDVHYTVSHRAGDAREIAVRPETTPHPTRLDIHAHYDLNVMEVGWSAGGTTRKEQVLFRFQREVRWNATRRALQALHVITVPVDIVLLPIVVPVALLTM